MKKLLLGLLCIFCMAPSMPSTDTPAKDRPTAAAPSAVRLSNGTAFVNPTTPSDIQPISLGSISINGTPAFTLSSLPAGSVAINGSVAVTGSFWQSTQPVSLASLPALSASTASIGTIVNGGGTVTVANASLAVTGTFWQSTQPISIASMPSTPVTGTFWQSTQPVSLSAMPALAASTANIGSVTVANASIPVTGTFWQSIQPVSLGSITLNTGTNSIGTVTVANASFAVTGTFWQSTQPVSLASLPALVASTANIGSVTIANASIPVTGTFWQNTQPISLGSITLNTGTNSIGTITNGGGTVTVNASSNNIGSVTIANASVPVTGTFWQATQPVSQSTIPPLVASSANIGSVTIANASVPVSLPLTDTTTGDTGTKTATFNGATQTNPGGRAVMILVKLGTVSGTTPTMTCQFQWSYDGGTSWLNVGTTLANLTASNQTGLIVLSPNNISNAGSAPATIVTGATVQALFNAPVPKTWRLTYTIGGTTPSFALTNTYVTYTN